MLARTQLSWLPLLLVLCLFALMISLSFWQLHRYFQKQELVSHSKRTSHETPLTWTQFLAAKHKEFRPLEIQGHFLSQKTILLDNRWHQKQIGYEVLTPFKIKGVDRLLLVNRGWVAKITASQVLGLQNPSKQTQLIEGYAKRPSSRGFILGKNMQHYSGGPPRIQRIDLKDIAEYLHYPVYPYVLRLSPDSASGFVREWVLVVGKPEKHLGYALQWFLLAVTLLIAYYFFARRQFVSRREEDDHGRD